MWQPLGNDMPNTPSAVVSSGCGRGPARARASSVKPIERRPAWNFPFEYESSLSAAPSFAAATRHEIRRDADDAQLAGTLRLRAPLRKAFPVRVLQCVVHHRLEVAGIVSGAVRGLVRHRVARNEVPAAQRYRVEAVLVSG